MDVVTGQWSLVTTVPKWLRIYNHRSLWAILASVANIFPASPSNPSCRD